MCPGSVNSSCCTSGTRRVTLVTNSVISHERRKDRKVMYVVVEFIIWSCVKIICLSSLWNTAGGIFKQDGVLKFKHVTLTDSDCDVTFRQDVSLFSIKDFYFHVINPQIQNLVHTTRFGNNHHYPRFENYNNLWLVKTPAMKKTYSRVLLGHITGCN